MAPGIDRIVMLLAGKDNIREVTLFPMNQNAEDLLMGAPSKLTDIQLKELNNKKLLLSPNYLQLNSFPNLYTLLLFPNPFPFFLILSLKILFFSLLLYLTL